MGTVLEIYQSKYDYVEHKYFSVFQVPLLDINKKVNLFIKVIMFKSFLFIANRAENRISNLIHKRGS